MVTGYADAVSLVLLRGRDVRAERVLLSDFWRPFAVSFGRSIAN
jgi:hypothetical protein